MAVYDRRYKAYEGPLTPVASRWRVLPRHAWTGVFRSRLFVGFFTLCFAWPIAAAVWIYLHYNLAALANVGFDGLNLAAVDAPFFAAFMGVQCFALGGVMTLLVGPGLVSRTSPTARSRSTSRARSPAPATRWGRCSPWPP